jgi:hypothetical protein
MIYSKVTNTLTFDEAFETMDIEDASVETLDVDPIKTLQESKKYLDELEDYLFNQKEDDDLASTGW